MQESNLDSRVAYQSLADVFRQSLSKNSYQQIKKDEDYANSVPEIDRKEGQKSLYGDRHMTGKRSHSDENVKQYVVQGNVRLVSVIQSLSPAQSIQSSKNQEAKSEINLHYNQRLASGILSEHQSSLQSLQNIRLIQEEHKARQPEPPTFNQMRQESFNQNNIGRSDSNKLLLSHGVEIPALQ